MRKKPVKIGDTEYDSKKAALSHYKEILNSYSFGQSLSDSHYNDLLGLLDYSFHKYLSRIDDLDSQLVQNDSNVSLEDENNESDALTIIDIKVYKVQFNTKCFEVIYKDYSSEYISYLMIINDQEYTAEKLFYSACRNVIHKDIMCVKQEFFKRNAIKGLVKCQETGVLSQWADLAVDHRQPNTFSIIVDRFKEYHKINPEDLSYTSNADNMIIFKDDAITQMFVKYHADKANLRLVRKGCNSSRSALARIKRSSKDLTVSDTNQLSLF